MKKQNIKNLALKRNTISNLSSNEITGGSHTINTENFKTGATFKIDIKCQIWV